MEGKPYRGSRGGAKARKKKFYETQDFLRKLLKKLAARWGEDYHLPRIEYDAADPAIASIEDIDWSLVTSLDTLVVHVLACTVPSLRSLLDKLNLSVDRKPQLAPGDGPPSPRPWQVAGASGGPPNPRGPNVPTHQDWDAVRDDPELSARLALYDPEEDAQPPSAGAAASTDPVVIVHAEGAADGAPELDREPAATPEPAEPFLVPEADLVVQEADDLPLGNEEAVQHSPLVNQGEEVSPEERGTADDGEGAAEGAPGEAIQEFILGGGEAADQSSPEEELLDNHPLADAESDREQAGAEDTVQEGAATVQNPPPARSRSRDSTRSRSRERVLVASPVPVEGLRPPLSARNPLILTPAVPGYPTIRHDRAGVWQLVAAQQSGSAARGALSAGSRSPPAEAEAEPLPISEAIDPHELPAAAWVDPEGWLETSGWDTSAPDTSGQISGEVFNLAEEDEVLEQAEDVTEPQGEGADSVAPEEAPAEGAASGAPAAPGGATSTRKRGPPDSGGDSPSDSSDEDVPLAPAEDLPPAESSEDEPLAPPEEFPQSEPSVPKFVSVPKGPKISGPPAKLARGGTQTRIPVRLVPASRQRSVYISDSELDRGAPTSSEATHTPKSVPPSPGSASRASPPPPAPPRQKARPRSTSATPIAGSVPPAPKGAASRAPTSTPVGELRTGRIGEAGTTFEELRETLTAWVGQVAPEQEGIVAEALRRAAFEQGQFRGQSAQTTPAPSGAAASAPAVLSSASDAEPIIVEDRGDDIGLVNSDGEPETHHPFTTEGIPPPEPDGLVRGANRVQPRSSSVPAVPQKAPPTVTGGSSSSAGPKVPYKVPPVIPPRPNRTAPEVTVGQGAASSAPQVPQFGSPQVAPDPRPPQYKAPPVLPTQSTVSFKGPPHRVFVAEIRPGPDEFRTPRRAPWHFDHGPRLAYHAWNFSRRQEQQSRGRTGSQPPPEPPRPPRPHQRAASSALANREPVVLCIDWHGVLDRGWDQGQRAFTPSARAAILNFCQQNQPVIFAILSYSAEYNHQSYWAAGIGPALRDLESFLPEYIQVLGAQCSARVGQNGKARFSQTLRPHPPNIYIDDKPIICRELRKTGAIVIQSNPNDPQGLQDDLLAAQQAIDARGRNHLPIARYLQDSELLFEFQGRR